MHIHIQARASLAAFWRGCQNPSPASRHQLSLSEREKHRIELARTSRLPRISMLRLEARMSCTRRECLLGCRKGLCRDWWLLRLWRWGWGDQDDSAIFTSTVESRESRWRVNSKCNWVILRNSFWGEIYLSKMARKRLNSRAKASRSSFSEYVNKRRKE
jgi:hypothetical protein